MQVPQFLPSRGRARGIVGKASWEGLMAAGPRGWGCCFLSIRPGNELRQEKGDGVCGRYYSRPVGVQGSSSPLIENDQRRGSSVSY